MRKRRFFWAVWFSLTVFLYFFENNTGTRILTAAAFVITPLTVFCAYYSAHHLKLEWTFPDSLRKGIPGEGCCVLSGPFLLRGCSAFGLLRADNPLTGECEEKELELSAGRNELGLASEHCGSLELRMAELKVRDLFGLFEFPVNTETENAAVVLPELYPVLIFDPGRYGSQPGTEDEGERSRQSDAAAFGEVREYVPGDPIRRIHWKLSEKTDRVLIRDNEYLPEKGLRLTLNTAPETADAERIDRAVEAMLSLSQSLCLEGYRHSVCWTDQTRHDCVEAEIASETDFFRMEEALLLTPVGSAEKDSGTDPRREWDERTVLFDPDADGLPCSENGFYLEG